MVGFHRGLYQGFYCWTQAVAGRVPWIRVSPSTHLSQNFLRIESLTHYWLSETQHGVRGPCGVVVDRAAFFFFFFGPRNEENENLVINFFWIWSIKKFRIICCILAETPFLGKIWFLGAKMLLANKIAWFLNWLHL